MTPNTTAFRRTVLKTIAGIAVTLGVGTASASADAQEDADFELDGQTPGWIGIAPESIADEDNPTLELEVGQQYTVYWRNIDGDPHNFVILDGEDNQLVRTEIIQFGDQTVEFEATEEMTEYLCEVHPETMRGDVELVGGGGQDTPEDGETPADETPADETTVESVVEISGERVPENLAFDDDGALYFGITAGEVWRLSADQTQETGLTLDDAEQVGTLPGSAIGVEVGPDGTLYVASQSEEGTGVWAVPQDGGDPSLFATIPSAEGESDAFPNDVLHDDERERLLVTESFGGVVYEVPLDADDPENAASQWAAPDSLDTEAFGANGLTFGENGDLFVAVTRATNDAGEDVGRLVRVPAAEDGSAGDAETSLESEAIFGADGITARESDLFVAANSLNEVVRITAEQETETVASGDDGLVFPSDVLFSPTEDQRDTLFICNFANESPEDGAVLRTEL